jgi:hypothetical protein
VVTIVAAAHAGQWCGFSAGFSAVKSWNAILILRGVLWRGLVAGMTATLRKAETRLRV